MPRTSRCQDGDGRLQERQICLWLQLSADAPAATFHHDEINHKRSGKDIDVDILAHACYQGPFNFRTSCVTAGMQDTSPGVRGLAPQ